MEDKILKYFSGLVFDETSHTYTYDGYSLKPVSYAIKNFVQEVDFEKIAEFSAIKYNKTKEQLLSEWDYTKNSAAKLGTDTHSFCENYIPGKSIPQNGYEKAFVSFWNSIPDFIIPVYKELRMFSQSMRIAGTADIIFYNKNTGKYIIADYKTNKNLFKNFNNNKLLTPFSHLLDSPYNKYQIQLSFYQILLEQTGIEVESRKIIWLKPNGQFEIYKTEDLTSRLLNAFRV